MSQLTKIPCTIICFLTYFHGTAAIDIKWTPNKNNKDNEAATAPRSQRYWDEHNIERPDYAKTDWEIAQENLLKKKQSLSTGTSLWLAILLILVIIIIGGIRYQKKQRKGYFYNLFYNNTTKTSSGKYTQRNNGDAKHSSEELRRARLAKLDNLNKSLASDDDDRTMKKD